MERVVLNALAIVSVLCSGSGVGCSPKTCRRHACRLQRKGYSDLRSSALIINQRGVGRARGAGRGLGVGVALGVAVGVTVGVDEGVGVGLGVGETGIIS